MKFLALSHGLASKSESAQSSLDSTHLLPKTSSLYHKAWTPQISHKRETCKIDIRQENPTHILTATNPNSNQVALLNQTRSKQRD